MKEYHKHFCVYRYTNIIIKCGGKQKNARCQNFDQKTHILDFRATFATTIADKEAKSK